MAFLCNKGLVSPAELIKSFARLVNESPYRSVGQDLWVSAIGFILTDSDRALPLEALEQRYLLPARASLLAFKGDTLSKRALSFVGKLESFDYGCWKLELRYKYNGACDWTEYQFRVWFTPTRKTVSVPSYFWLGELAEA